MNSTAEHRTGPDPGALVPDGRLAAALADEGYAVVPLLGPDAVATLRRAYHHLAPGRTGMDVGYMDRDRSVMSRTRDLVAPVFEDAASRWIGAHQLVLVTYAVKHPGGDETAMFLHDDRSFVDESRHRTLTFWIPLVDVGPHLANGGLEVVPRSHLLPTGLSGSHTPDLVRPYEADLRAALRGVPVRAGEALVYDSRLLHASGPNRTATTREAVVCAVAPADAELIHVVATGRRNRRVHRVDARLFVDQHIRDMEVEVLPRYPVVAEFTDDITLPPDTVARILGIETPTRRAVVPDDLPLPDDLAAAARSGAEFDWHPVAVTPRSHDLTVGSSTLGGGRMCTGIVVSPLPPRRAGSGVGQVGVRRARRWRADTTGLDLPELATLPRSTVDADVVVVDAGASARLEVPRGRGWAHHLTVVETAELASGLVGDGRAMNLSPGRRVVLPGGSDLIMWNDGPGPLVAILSRALPLSAARLAVRDGVPAMADRARRSAQAAASAGRRARFAATGAATSFGERAVGTVLRIDDRLVEGSAPRIDAPLDPTDPPWSKPLADGWADIRGELDALLADEVSMPETRHLAESDQGAEGIWTTYVLHWYGRWLPDTARRCPRTVELLRGVDDLQVAGFTVLGPHTHIPRHQGPAKSYRWQMGMRVPGPPGAACLRVGDQVVEWAEGRTAAFDDRSPHEAWNDADEARYVLFVQVPWPMGGWRGRVHRAVGAGFGVVTRRIGRNAERLDRQLNPGR